MTFYKNLFHTKPLPCSRAVVSLASRVVARVVSLGAPKSILFLLAFLIFSVSLAGVAFAFGGELFSSDKPVEVVGDKVTYDSARQTYYAIGNVVVTQEGTALKADEVTMNMQEGTAHAIGNVFITSAAGDAIEGDELTIDIDKDTAIAVNASLYLAESTMTVTGSTLRKTAKTTYKIKDARFTTCECDKDETPAWHFSSKSAKVKTDGYLLAWNTFLKVKDVPILYSPVLVAPVGGGRKTGFLMPVLGSSDKQGTVIDNTFFWAISKSTDASFYFDTKSKRGIGEGVEYRYYRTADSNGELYLYHFEEKDLDRVRESRRGNNNMDRPLSAHDGRWQMKLKHNEKFANGFKLMADIDVVSDDEYFLDFASSSAQRSLESLESTISLSKSWDKYSFTAQARTYDNLLLEDDDPVLQKLPEIIFNGSSQRILGSPFFLSFNTTFVNYERNEGEEGQRLDVRPRVSLPLRPGGWFEFTPSVAPRMTLYRLEDDTSRGRYHGRGLYDITTNLTTTFVKNYRPAFENLKVLRHTIRPKIVHTYIPDYKQTRLPYYDSVDRIEPANTVRYSLNSILTGKFGDTSKHEYLYMDIAQTYDIREDNGKSKRTAGDERPFSDISAELILRPTLWSKLKFKGLYDPYEKWMESSDSEVSLWNKRGDSLSITYRDLRGSTRYMEAAATVNLTPAHYVKYRDRYNFYDDELLERSVIFGYVHQCWGVEFEWSKGLDDTVVFLTLTMKGLGEVLTTRATVSKDEDN